MTLAPLERLPPHDIEAEEAVIASLMVDPQAMLAVQGIIKPADFFREKNGWVYDSACRLWNRDEVINQITVAHELASRDQLEEVGGQVFLADVIRRLPTSLGAEFYARIVKRDSMYRGLIHAATGILQMAYEAPAEIDDVFSKSENLLQRLDPSARVAGGNRNDTMADAELIIELNDSIRRSTTVSDKRPGSSYESWSIGRFGETGVPSNFTTR